jgi:hypothetical protein
MTEKTPNYSPAQEQIIRDYAVSNAPLNIAKANELAAMPTMFDNDGNQRKAASIVAKIARLGLAYERKQPVTKTGEPVVKKTELVARIAELAGVNAATLDGMEKSPKDSLAALVEALGAQIVFEPEAVNG